MIAIKAVLITIESTHANSPTNHTVTSIVTAEPIAKEAEELISMEALEPTTGFAVPS